jgi:putative ATPase
MVRAMPMITMPRTGFSGQDYFPEGVKRPVLYTPVDRGFERDMKKRVDWFASLRAKRGG